MKDHDLPVSLILVVSTAHQQKAELPNYQGLQTQSSCQARHAAVMPGGGINGPQWDPQYLCLYLHQNPCCHLVGFEGFLQLAHGHLHGKGWHRAACVVLLGSPLLELALIPGSRDEYLLICGLLHLPSDQKEYIHHSLHGLSS